ncbi:MAG: nucleotidyltransferase family protein [Chitinispirillaceae bacterium]|nr:nucleotidyltransferase family protein [Chitinispirillaceae bacterium]
MAGLSRWIALQIVYGDILDILEKMFALHGHDFMPVKGAYLIKTGIAEQISDRKMVDIDILIKENQFNTVCQWFSQCENVKEKYNYWCFERSFIYLYSGIPVHLEFHRLINFPERFLLPNEDLFERGKRISQSCILPDPVDSLLIHICHKLAHVIDGFEDLFYEEISLYSSQNGFDWKTFWERARKTGIISFIWLVLEKWKKRKQLDEFYLPAPPSFYAALLSRTGLFMKGNRAIVRKFFFEVPFVRDSLKLAVYKIRETYLKK